MNLTLSVDATRLLNMLAQLAPETQARVLEASLETGRLIQQEAKSRVSHKTKRATGITAAAITVEAGVGTGRFRDDKSGSAVRVFVGPTKHPANLPSWLEFGTRHMTAKEFLFVSARLEEGGHLKRVERAVQAAIDEVNR